MRQLREGEFKLQKMIWKCFLLNLAKHFRAAILKNGYFSEVQNSLKSVVVSRCPVTTNLLLVFLRRPASSNVMFAL